MLEFARKGGAVLHCSHLLDVVEAIAHRVAVLDRGYLLACGTMDELRLSTGSGQDKNLEAVFRTLTHASDPLAIAKAILGGA
jgi:ABC-2 type transport system ATP-binding protein